MFEERRRFLKATLGAGAVGVSTFVAANCGLAGEKAQTSGSSNGVVTGHSPKKEILYKKNQNWETYYKAAY
jgi:hypothetical protein